MARTESRVEVHGREVKVALVLNLRDLKDPAIDLHDGGRKYRGISDKGRFR